MHAAVRTIQEAQEDDEAAVCRLCIIFSMHEPWNRRGGRGKGVIVGHALGLINLAKALLKHLNESAPSTQKLPTINSYQEVWM